MELFSLFIFASYCVGESIYQSSPLFPEPSPASIRLLRKQVVSSWSTKRRSMMLTFPPGSFDPSGGACLNKLLSPQLSDLLLSFCLVLHGLLRTPQYFGKSQPTAATWQFAACLGTIFLALIIFHDMTSLLAILDFALPPELPPFLLRMDHS